MKERSRRILYAGGVAVLLVLGLLVVVPILFRGPVQARVKTAASSALRARVDWTGLELGLFRHFPNLTLRLAGLSVTGIDRFAGDTLLTVPEAALVLDLGSVVSSLRGGSPIVVRSVSLTEPRLRLLVLGDGAASWDITRPSAAPAAGSGATSGRALAVSLRGLEITDGRITLENRKTGTSATLAGLRHTLSGDFSERRFDLRTRTVVDSAFLRFGGVPYLSGERLGLVAALDADMAAHRFTLKDDTVRVNELALVAAGSVQQEEGDVALDLTFAAPRAGFRQILSLVPLIYTRSFARLQADGQVSVQGKVKGRLGKGAFPSFGVSADVGNASFRYPGLPLPARDIALHLAVTNPGGSADATVLNLDRFHIRIGDDPVDGSLVLRTPLSDPDVAFRVAGRLDLANLPRTIRMDSVRELRGIVSADAAMRARLSDVRAKRYERVAASGNLAVSGLGASAAGLRRPVAIDTALLRLTPQRAELAAFRARAGASDVRMTGALDNVLGFVLGREDLRGSARVASTRVDLNEWRSEDATRAVPVPGRIDFALDASADTVKYGTLTLRDARGALRVRNRRLTLDNFSAGTLGGGLSVDGYYETLDPMKPTFDGTVALKQVEVPAAFAGMRTVQAFAPVARYAQGHASVQLQVSGALGQDMMPVLKTLTGAGSLATSGLVLQEFPPLDALARTLKLQLLQNPGFQDLKSSFSIRDGRLHVQPFQTRVGQVGLNIAGSNGTDGSLDYTVGLRAPRAVLGPQAADAVRAIAERAGRVGVNIDSAATVGLSVKIGGTITKPTISTSLGEVAGGAVQAVKQGLEQQAARGKELVQARVDSTATAAAAKARAEADRALADAEQKAAAIRAEARARADTLRAQAAVRIDSLAAKATNPVARIAANAAATRLKKETDAKADALVKAADARADSVMAAARRKAGTDSVKP